MKKLLLVFLLLCGLSSAQTHTFPALDTNNTFTGTNIFTGPIQFNNGLIPVLFASLPLASDGTIIYCPDCVAAIPCAQGTSLANGGTDGAFALRVNGAWSCSANGTSNIPGALTLSGLTVNGTSFSNQSGNGADTNVSQRATDSSPTGTFYRCRNHAGNADLCMIDANGVIWAKNLLIDSTLPRFAIPITNGGGGTTYKLLAKTAGGVLVTCLTTDTAIPCWPIDTTLTYNGTTYCAPGATGNACVVRSGHTTLTADAGGFTDGDWIGASTTSAGKGKDLGATLPAGPLCVIGRAVGAAAGNADGTISINQFCYPATASSGSTVLYQEASAGATTNSNSSAAVNMFTGYSMPGGTLTSGHSLHIVFCAKHTTGATATSYKLVFGGSTVTFFGGSSTAASAFCDDVQVMATGASQEYVNRYGLNPGAGGIAADVAQSIAETLSGSIAINISQTAAGNTDVYTAYMFKVVLE